MALTFALYLSPCRSPRDSAGQLALPGGCRQSPESCLSPRPWQGDWQPQHCACPRLSRKAPSVRSVQAPKLMTSAGSRVCRPHDPCHLPLLLPLCHLPPPPSAMQPPRAASKVETLKPAMGGSSHQHPGSPRRSPGSGTVRGISLRTVSQLRTAPEEQARVCSVTSLPILPGDRAFARNRPQGTSRAAFSCHWHK